MTLRLILTRHTKSSWDNINQPDHERPLNPRGRSAASAIGEWIETRGYSPDLILCSTATRTRETCALILEALSSPPSVIYVKELYHASSEQILAALEQVEATNILVIGHNPGISQFASTLAKTPPSNERFSVYPTGATTVLEFAQDSWADIGPCQQGSVRDFVVPKDLGVD